MAIILGYIETELAPNHKATPLPPASPQMTYTKIHSNWKIATDPQPTELGKPPCILPDSGWTFEPGVEQRGPGIITRPTGHKIAIPEPEGLDPITLFNTQYNSRPSVSVSSSLSLLSTPKKQRKKRRVTFAKKHDIIPPVCTDLVLYRGFGPDSCLSYTAAPKGVMRFRRYGFWVMALTAVGYLSLFFLGSPGGFFNGAFKVFLV